MLGGLLVVGLMIKLERRYLIVKGIAALAHLQIELLVQILEL